METQRKNPDHTSRRARGALDCALPAPSKAWRFLALAVVLLSTLHPQLATLFAQGTAFTYQGRLNDGGAVATGSYDLRFAIYDLNTGGSVAGGPLTNSTTGVSNGLFTVTLDFGAGVFSGASRWLEVAVRTAGGGTFTNLAPRQLLTAAPYAIAAGQLNGTIIASQLTGVVASPQLSGTYASPVTFSDGLFAGSFFGNGAGLSNLPVAALSGVLQVQTNTSGAPSLILGALVNFVASNVLGAVISGGGAADYSGPRSNAVFANFGAVGGGFDNAIQADSILSVIAGGVGNRILTNSADSVIGGGYLNLVGPNSIAGTIAGGYQNAISSAAGTAFIGGGGFNTISSGSGAAVIAGGGGNTIGTNASNSTIAGGNLNEIQANSWYASIGGGNGNTIRNDADSATVAGGELNSIQDGSSYSVIGGGYGNSIDPNTRYAVIPGGMLNGVSGDFGFAAGRQAQAQHTGAFVWADSQDQYWLSTAPNQFLIRAAGGVGIGTNQPASALHVAGTVTATAFNGTLNASQVTAGTLPDARLSTNIARLNANQTLTGTLHFSPGATPPFTVGNNITVPGLSADFVDGKNASEFAAASHTHVAAEIVAGTFADARLAANIARTNQVWLRGGNSGTTAGTDFLGTTDSQALELKVNGLRALRLEPTPNNVSQSNVINVIAGAPNNAAINGAVGVTIAGGGAVRLSSSTQPNIVAGDFATIGGGRANIIAVAADGATIAGGAGGIIQSSAIASVIGGGANHEIQPNASYSTIGGGNNNTVGTNAQYATVPGGLNNLAAGNYSLAAGRRARANHAGAFVWADSQNTDFASAAADEFALRASGGVRLNDDTSLSFGATTRQMLNLYSTTYGIGVQSSTLYQRSNSRFAWYVGGTHSDTITNSGGGTTLMMLSSAGLTVNGTFVSASDRNVKENFAPVNSRDVLAKVAALPLTQWNYKADAGTRHLGPMAQDFHAAFGVGPDDKHISMVDADGVALAAIQGLNQKVEEQRSELKARDEEIQALKVRVTELEQLKQTVAQLLRSTPPETLH